MPTRRKRKSTRRKLQRKASSSRRVRKTQQDVFDILNIGVEPLKFKPIKPTKIEVPTFDLSLLPREVRRINPNKLSKLELVNILSRRLTWKQVYDALISLGKHRSAEELRIEAERINERYRKLAAEISGEKEEFNIQHRIFNTILEEIISHMKGLYTLSVKPFSEYEFHRQIEPFLAGIASVLEKSLVKFGMKIDVKREFRLPSNERIDLLITIGGYKIGVEVKLSLKKSSELQRLLGQIDKYIPYCDTLLVVTYYSIDGKAIKMIKNKEQEKGKMIKILAPNKVV